MDKTNAPPIIGDVSIMKQRRKRQKLLLVEVFSDFANNTTLHGLRYFSKPGLQIIEKIFWFITFASSLMLSFYFIYNVWWKWKSSPVIVSFSEKHVPVEMVPFPSVTICPQAKFKQSEFNYSELHSKNSDYLYGYYNDTLFLNYTKDFEISDALSLLCDVGDTFRMKEHIEISDIDHILRLSLEIDEIIYQCKISWIKSPYCKESFKRVLTEEGVCYNLNSLPPNEILREENIQHEYKYMFSNESSRNWTMAQGYLTDDPDPYPGRGRDNGGVPDLHIELMTIDDEKDKLCNGLYNGYKIFLHHPADFPESSIYYYAALPKQLSSIALRFTMVTTSENLRSYPLETRQCYFPEDKPLRYFRHYTLNNCKLECLSNYTYKRCKCVPFFLPHNNSKEICSASRMYCVNEARDELAGKYSRHKKNGCFCLPACNSVQYDADIHKTEYDMGNLLSNYLKVYKLERRDNDTDINKMGFIKVDIFFRDSMYMSVHRSELFGLTDFLSNCGGLLGLFLGFSFLSLIEIFYFLTFRVFYTIKVDLKKEKKEGLKNLNGIKDE